MPILYTIVSFLYHPVEDGLFVPWRQFDHRFADAIFETLKLPRPK